MKPRSYVKRKKDIPKNCGWSSLPSYLLMTISSYSCESLHQIFWFSHVCSIWRGHIMSEEGYYFWNTYKDGENLANFSELKNFLKKYLVEQQEKMSLEFEKRFTKLFNYGSTK